MINALMADIQAPGSPGGSHPALDYRQREFPSSLARSSFASYLEQISRESSFSTAERPAEGTASTNLARQDEFALREAQQQREAALLRSAEQDAAEEHRRLQADAQAASESRRASSAESNQTWTESRDKSDATGTFAEQKNGPAEDRSRIDEQNENSKNEKPLVNTEKIEDGKSSPRMSTPASGEKAASKTQSSEGQLDETVQVDTTKIDEGAQESSKQVSAEKRISAEDAREAALKQTFDEKHTEKLVQSGQSRVEAEHSRASRKAELKELQLNSEAAAQAAMDKNSTGENELQSAAVAAEGSHGGVVGEKSASAAVSEEAAKKGSLQPGASQPGASQPGGDEKRGDRGTNDPNSRRTGESEGRPKLTVIDKRGASSRNNSGNHTGSESRQQSSEFKLFSSGNESVSSTGKGISNENGDSLQVMQVNLRGDAGQSSSAASAKSIGSGVRNELMQQLQDHLNKDIVKRSSILIRENGSGEIKLDLKPDNLGQVRIRITMENNNIAGKIFVENSNVKEAFDQNMQQLYRAFKEHGFENAALNVSVGDQGSEQHERGRSNGPQLSPSSQVRALDEQGAPTNDSSGELRLIDVMA